MSSSVIQITPEVVTDGRMAYLIRVNQEEMCLVHTEEDAKLVIDSVAADEVRRMTNDYTKVYRQDLEEGKRVILSTQSLGTFVNGRIRQVEDIDYIQIGYVSLLKGRLEKNSEKSPSKIDCPTLMSVPDLLEKLALERRPKIIRPLFDSIETEDIIPRNEEEELKTD
jgi:hypothetical protein